jgi:hypothetical protein
MSRPTSPTPSASALRMRKHLERRRQGLEVLPQPWDWITAAQAQEMALQAFRAATWTCRADTAVNFADELVAAFEILVTAQAERAGHRREVRLFEDPESMARGLVEAVPADWRHQYPRFGAPGQGVEQ